MNVPKRVQRTRKRGGGMPAGAVYVGRPSKWGNPYTGDGPINHSLMKRYFEEWINRPECKVFREEVREALGGKDLACWCPLDKACHADVLLEIANSREDEQQSIIDADMAYICKVAMDEDDIHFMTKFL